MASDPEFDRISVLLDTRRPGEGLTPREQILRTRGVVRAGIGLDLGRGAKAGLAVQVFVSKPHHRDLVGARVREILAGSGVEVTTLVAAQPRRRFRGLG